MLISHNWLRELTNTNLSPLELRERLTMVGLAIDAVEEREDDAVLDVEVPSNRPDCLSHIGIAREVAVIEDSQVQSPTSTLENTSGNTEDFAGVEILDTDLCPRYAAWVIRGTTIAPSPGWLVRRLESIGQRPINNVADITNLVLHEVGQPLHAFDLAKLKAHRIVVRRANAGEKIKTLDGVERELDSDMLVIADAQNPVALAGVMGGEDSEISNATRDVLIESAYFNPASVRRTAQRLGMHTEASHRFERGGDIEGVRQAQERCVSLICEIAGGTATVSPLDVYPAPHPTRTVGFRSSRVRTLTGLEVTRAETDRILTKLGFIIIRRTVVTGSEVKFLEGDDAGHDQVFAVPSWRGDVEREEDLVEEIARHTGYQKIASELPPAGSAGEYFPGEKRKRAVRRTLAAMGFDEAISFSFVDASHDNQIEPIPALAGDAGTSASDAENFVTLKNPIIEDWTRMRPTLLPGLLNAVKHNLNHGNRDVCLFEIGRVFGANRIPGEMPNEREALALVATGGKRQAGEAGSAELGFFDLKGAIEAAFEAMNVPALTFTSETVKHLRHGQAANIRTASGVKVGTIGTLTDEIGTNYKFRQKVFVAEVDLSTLLELGDQPVFYSPLPRFPSVVRDVSLLLDRKVAVADLLQAVAVQELEECRAAGLVGVFEGDTIPDGKRSVTLRMEYRAADRTLRDTEVDQMHWRIVKALENDFHAEVR
ncbi:MAG: phenylalanyl-tRNA synthetase beta chain [Blastocatellia bacterium]|jgi:phenylalanyl-tRNA synthetase beta chain|nr:phenylalanyl-tRNA synthetase beta chain [Blastocatellia bacterium]